MATCTQCSNAPVVGLEVCEDHAEECTCLCADCERRGVHFAHSEDGEDFDCPNDAR